MRSGKTIFNNHVGTAEDERWRLGSMNYQNAVMCAALTASEEGVGVIWLGRKNPFDEEDIHLIKTITDIAGSALHRFRLSEENQSSFIETVLALAKTLDARDSQTADHSYKMAVWAEATLARFGATPNELRSIHMAALLHDIGKIGVPDEILRKNGPLTDEEMAVMQRHPLVGAEIVAPIRKLEDVAPIIRSHQEKWNGEGYPSGLEGEEIPLAARVLTIVDAYAAMTEDRVYRKARPPVEAVAELRACSGTDFDPQVVEIFIEVIKEFGEI